MDKIELIFNMYKDSVVVSKPFKREMIKRYKLSDEEIRNLYIRIQNYQVNHLGGRLTYQERSYTDDERRTVNRQATQRRYGKRNPKEKSNLLQNYFGDVIGEVDSLIKQASELKN